MDEFENYFDAWEEDACSDYEQPKYYCEECGEPIYEGDTYYDLSDAYICEECMSNKKRKA